MSETPAGRVRDAIEELALRHYQYEAAQIMLADYNGRVSDVNKAEDALMLAARNLANAVDDMPPDRRPKGWALTLDAETA